MGDDAIEGVQPQHHFVRAGDVGEANGRKRRRELAAPPHGAPHGLRDRVLRLRPLDPLGRAVLLADQFRHVSGMNRAYCPP